jgi:hypothetical protein
MILLSPGDIHAQVIARDCPIRIGETHTLFKPRARPRWSVPTPVVSAIPRQPKETASHEITDRSTLWDANCPQHIRPRHGAEEEAETLLALQRRLDELETENRALRQQAAAYEQTAEDSTPRR